MSLADLVPVLLATKIERRRIGRAEEQRRYQRKNRKKLNAYQRQWYHARKAS